MESSAAWRELILILVTCPSPMSLLPTDTTSKPAMTEAVSWSSRWTGFSLPSASNSLRGSKKASFANSSRTRSWVTWVDFCSASRRAPR